MRLVAKTALFLGALLPAFLWYCTAPRPGRPQEDSEIYLEKHREAEVEESLIIDEPPPEPTPPANYVWQWADARIHLPVTTTAYPYYDGGDNRTCDNRLVRPSDYTFAVSRDLENLRLKSGRVIDLRERVIDARTGGWIYRWRAFIPGYSKLGVDGKPLLETLAVPRDRMPKSVWIDDKRAQAFRMYKWWNKQGLFLDARLLDSGKRQVRVSTKRWVDVMYTHPGRFSSIENRCLVEWGKLHPDHFVMIQLYELKPVEVPCE
jgi:hypothetical protein